MQHSVVLLRSKEKLTKWKEKEVEEGKGKGCKEKIKKVWKRLLTKRLRQIRNAWHSQVILSFVFKVQWFRLGADVAHYLTRR